MEISSLIFCPVSWGPKLLIFTSQAPHLLYYSHIPSVIIALLLGFFLYFRSKTLVAKILFFISLTFLVWAFFDLYIWVNSDSRLMMFFWSMINLLEMLITSSTLYFSYVFLEKKDAPLKYKIIISLLLGLFIILIPTTLNLTGFNAPNCEAEQGPLTYYFYSLEILFFLWLLVYLIKKIVTTKGEEKKETAYFSVGAIFFLASFSGANLAGSLAAFLNPDSPNNWLILQYGLFGMPIFMALLTYIIVKYKAFNIKLALAQALIIAIVILVASQFAFIQNSTNRILTSITLIIVTFFGWWLVRSVKKEVKQREELAILNYDLQQLIKQRESLVHLITHKVKGSFTRSKYIFAELLEGTFGPITDKTKDIVEQGLNSDNEGIKTVDLVLNAANFQSGKVKYDMKTLDFKDLAAQIVKDKKEQAETKGLKLKADIKKGDYKVQADAFWLKEAAQSLVDNAIKYTLKGSVAVGLENKNNKVLFSVKDTGVGITDEDKKNLFKEGGRGKDSVRINVDSTGYGLYTVKMIVEAHQGRAWAESDGQNKGSAFYLELPLTQK